MLDERGQLLAEPCCVLLVQVDLVRRAYELELHCLIGRSSVEIIFQLNGYLRCHPRPPGPPPCVHGTRSTALPGTTRPLRLPGWSGAGDRRTRSNVASIDDATRFSPCGRSRTTGSWQPSTFQ